MILALTLSAKTCNTLSADYSARLDALSLSLTRTSARACGTLTGDAAAFPKLINTLNRDINGALCRRAVRIAERLTLAADEIGQALPLDDEPLSSVCQVVAEAPAAELPAPVSSEVVEAPRVTIRPRALTLRALRLAVAAKRGEGARVEPRPALRYAARAPFRALAYLAARHPEIYALLTSAASEARMSWRSCPRAAAEALRWEALAQSDARGCSYCPAGYTWRGVARAVARAEAAAAKAPRRRRAR